ncbi:DUF4856 domain-containing protein [Arcicella sp. DC2W]|uniref:DUF4856 domain-containing protein n=1 Tax=Arcicella gelida TaxID=2984195 RepID=A0ABU5S2Z9_9BACT|nr:DUF4856 domain-containing protein [Arcicella sp. DC2W]MEA5402755.1 DUF4856 domain-containing protein [Arcicella sp. DC2W]
MFKRTYKMKFVLVALAIAGMTSCKDDDAVVAPLRTTKIDYATLTATTPYSNAFVDGGKTTVDLSNGNNRYKMFQALNTSMSSSISGNKVIDATVLKNMFANTNNPFVDSTKLNTSGVQLRNTVASSWSTAEAEVVKAKIETLFSEIAEASKSITSTAEKGKAGKLGSRLVDAKGIETNQIIQKSLIGALQYDYIGNVLLTKGLDADNSKLVTGKNYSQLEQNWDEAYAFLTLNQAYLAGSTNTVRGTTEFALGSYVWEYNQAAYPQVHLAFLKGRAAIVNNDKTELKKQADFIKAAFEKAIAAAAVGYLGKWGNRTSEADKVHDIGEGAGFIYSLRFCTVNGANAKFSDDILTALLGSANGYWDLTPAKISAASDAIKAKFAL